MEKFIQLDQKIASFNSSINSISILEDFLLTGHENGNICITNLVKKNPRSKKIEAHQNSITSISLSKNYQYLLTTSLDKSFKLWNLTQPMNPKVFHQKNFSACLRDTDFSPKSEFFVIGCDDKSAKIYSTKNFKFQTSLKGHSNWISSCNFSQADQNSVITGGFDKKVFLWDVAQCKSIFCQKLSSKISKVNFFSNDSYFLTAEQNGTVKIFDPRLNQLVQKYDAHQGNIKDIMFENSQFYFLSIGDDQKMKFWDLRNGKNFGVFEYQDQKLNCFKLYQNEKKIITGGMDIKIWSNPLSFQEKKIIKKQKKDCGTKICSNSQISANYTNKKIKKQNDSPILKPKLNNENLKVLQNVSQKVEKKQYQENPEITNSFNIIIDQLAKINETVQIMDQRIRKNEDDILYLTQQIQTDIKDNQFQLNKQTPKCQDYTS